jgi:hypothetical protein
VIIERKNVTFCSLKLHILIQFKEKERQGINKRGFGMTKARMNMERKIRKVIAKTNRTERRKKWSDV